MQALLQRLRAQRLRFFAEPHPNFLPTIKLYSKPNGGKKTRTTGSRSVSQLHRSNRRKLAALVFVFSLVSPVFSQTLTTVTASHISISGAPIAAGKVLLTPVNAAGQPIAFVTGGGGGLNAPKAFSCTITAGALSGCQVPDAAATTPANLLYTVDVNDTASGLTFRLPTVPNITGTNWALDNYAPSATTTNSQTVQVTYGAGAAPDPCATPSFYYQNGVGLNVCVGGHPVPVGEGSISASTMQAAVAAQTGCTTAGNAWNPATNTCLPATGGGTTNSNTSTANVLVCEGDSLTLPQGATNSNCSSANLGGLTDTYTINNEAIGCFTPAAALDSARGALIDAFYHPIAAHNVLVYNLGTNAEANSSSCNLTEGGNLALAEAHISAYLRARKAAGWQIVLVDVGSRGGETTFKNNLDAWERANWASLADRFVDLGSDPIVGCDTCNTNTTYFQSDTTHWTDATETRVGGYIAAAVNSLDGSLSNAVPVTYAANHTIAASETTLRGDATAGQVILTIPVSTARTGTSVEVKNISSTGTNALEVQASGIDTIDGGTCVTIPQGSTVKLRSVLTSASAATSEWENFGGGAYGAGCGGGGGGTISYVGDSTTFSGSAVTTQTVNYSCTVGNLVHVAVSYWVGSTTAAISSSPSATWTPEFTTMPTRSDGFTMQAWDETCPATGSQAITATSSVSAGINISVSELHGTNASKFDHVASGTADSSSTAVALSTTATSNNSAAIVDIGTGAGIGTFGTPTTGYTVKATSSNGTFHGWQSTTISSGAVSFGVTFGGSASNWLGTIAVFHP